MSEPATQAVRGAGAQVAAGGPQPSAPGEPGAAVVVVVQLGVGVLLALAVLAATALGKGSVPKQELAYALCFGACLPVAYLTGGRLARVLAARYRPSAVWALVGLGAGGALAVVLAARLAYALGAPAPPVLISGLVGWMAAMILASRKPAALEHLAAGRLGRRRVVWGGVAAGVVLIVVALLPPRSLRPGPLALSLLIAAALTLVALRWRWSRAGFAHALDALVVAVIVLLVVDARGYLQFLPYDPYAILPLGLRRPAGVLDMPAIQLFAQQLHQNFYMAPVNDVLRGRPVLVDTYSQYGVGAFYFLAAWFKLAPLGYGPLGLLSGLMTGAQYACAYGALRVAGCRPPAVIAALSVAVVALVLGAYGSLTQYPSAGGLRFLWAYALILVVVAGMRWPAWGRKALAAALAILAFSAAWSLEAMIYGLTIVAAAFGFQALASTEEPRKRWRRLRVDLGCAVGCCVGANLLLGLATLAFTGNWPDWRPYLAFFTAYGGGDVTALTASLAHPWSAGFGVGALYFTSALGLIRVVLRHPELTRERCATLGAIATCTAFGIVALSYWVTHSIPAALLPVGLPAIMVAALWITVARDARAALPRVVRVAALAFGLWFAALLVVFAWPEAEPKWRRTALWQAVPGTEPLRDNLRRLWASPRVDPRSAEAEALLARHLPGRGPVPMLIEPDLMVETLVRTRRANALPIGDLLQDALIRRHVEPRLNRAIDRLKPGDMMLVQLRPDPRIVPLEGSEPLLQAALGRVRQRFALRVVETSRSGLSIAQLASRSAS